MKTMAKKAETKIPGFIVDVIPLKDQSGKIVGHRTQARPKSGCRFSDRDLLHILETLAEEVRKRMPVTEVVQPKKKRTKKVKEVAS